MALLACCTRIIGPVFLFVTGRLSSCRYCYGAHNGQRDHSLPPSVFPRIAKSKLLPHSDFEEKNPSWQLCPNIFHPCDVWRVCMFKVSNQVKCHRICMCANWNCEISVLLGNGNITGHLKLEIAPNCVKSRKTWQFYPGTIFNIWNPRVCRFTKVMIIVVFKFLLLFFSRVERCIAARRAW